jgi:hypothetical protein
MNNKKGEGAFRYAPFSVDNIRHITHVSAVYLNARKVLGIVAAMILPGKRKDPAATLRARLDRASVRQVQ